MTSVDETNGHGHAGADRLPLKRPLALPATEAPPAGLQVGHVEAHPDKPVDTGVPINPPEREQSDLEKAQARRDAELRPILPAWASSREALKGNAAWAAKHYGHRAARRAVYAVPDGLRLTWWGIKGTWFTVAGLTRWTLDVDSDPLSGRIQAATQVEYNTTTVLRGRRQKVRLQIAGYGLLLLAIAAVAAWFWAPRWVFWAAASGVVALLIRRGKPADKPLLIGPTVVKQTAPRLTDVSIAQAFGALGLSPLRELVNRGQTSHLFVSEIVRTKAGNGYRVELTMPLGVTAAEIAAKRAKLAANLRRQVGQVWPLPMRAKHEAAVELLVLDKPFSQMKLPAWPLLATGKGNLMGEIPFGWSATGEKITFRLFENNMMIAAAPGQGKSGAVLVIASVGALDLRAELHLHELKGTNDMGGLQPVAHRFTTGSGLEEDLASVMASLREIDACLGPRAASLAKAQELGLAPERKATDALASDPKWGLWPLLLVIDELQELMTSDYRDEAEEILTRILKKGRALNVYVVLSTQNPDAKSFPKAADRLVMIRFCLRVLDQIANDQTLGTSSYQAGYRATEFDEDDKGIGLLKRGGKNVVTVRTNYLTADQVKAIGRRARVLREQSGRLTGDAIGDTRSAQAEDAATRSLVVVDCLDAWIAAEGDDTAWLSALEDVLAERHPDRYGHLKDEWLGRRLRGLKVPTMPQRKRSDGNGGQINRAGVAKAALLAHLDHEE